MLILSFTLQDKGEENLMLYFLKEIFQFKPIELILFRTAILPSRRYQNGANPKEFLHPRENSTRISRNLLFVYQKPSHPGTLFLLAQDSSRRLTQSPGARNCGVI